MPELIRAEYEGQICSNAELLPLIRHYPVELAYALALVGAKDEHSITPPWLMRNYPKIENVIKYLRGTPCADGCAYCREALNIHRELKRIFGYDSFRTYNGEPLQEKPHRLPSMASRCWQCSPQAAENPLPFSFRHLWQAGLCMG